MLVDQRQGQVAAGILDSTVHLPGEWISALVHFIADALPPWRDDPLRERVSSETRLTAQLCARLNSLTRHSRGWDFLQFRREEPEQGDGRRSIDLAVAPSGAVIWIEGHQYTDYSTLLPIECKRLPTPANADRDEREYLVSRFSTTGGVQRFKAGHHGRAHKRAVMIGYVQENNILFWQARLDAWIDGLVTAATAGWSVSDRFTLAAYNTGSKSAMLSSSHVRSSGLDPIQLDHIWIEM